ncbi:coatomer subunit alpha [Gonapodya sp. JEL0774]|nr:coatomer subunit alpha [Gonapodya sp. JEL0774]
MSASGSTTRRTTGDVIDITLAPAQAQGSAQATDSQPRHLTYSRVRPISPADFKDRVPRALWLAATYCHVSAESMTPLSVPFLLLGDLALSAALLYVDHILNGAGPRSIVAVAIFTLVVQTHHSWGAWDLAKFHKAKGTLHWASPVGRLMHKVVEALDLPPLEPRHNTRDRDICGCKKCLMKDIQGAATVMWITNLYGFAAWLVASICGTLSGMLSPKESPGSFSVGLIYILWFSIVRMGFTVACVHSSRLGTVYVLLGKMAWEQRRFQDSLFVTLRNIADLRQPTQPSPLSGNRSQSQLRANTASENFEDDDDYCKAHWSIMMTIQQEKRQLERIFRSLVELSLIHFFAFIVTTHASGCASGYWTAMALLTLSYFVVKSFVLAQFNAAALTTTTIIRRAERELAFLSLDLVHLKNKITLEALGVSNYNRTMTVQSSVQREDSGADLDQGLETSDPRLSAHGNEANESRPSDDLIRAEGFVPHYAVLTETMNDWNGTLPLYPVPDSYSGRTLPLALPQNSARILTRELLDARLEEAEGHRSVLHQLTRGDEFLVTFLGRPLTFELARAIAGVAIAGAYLAYELYRGGGYSFELAFSCVTKLLSRPNLPSNSTAVLPSSSNPSDRRSLDALLTTLLDQKRKLEAGERERDLLAVEEFLKGARIRKEEQKLQLTRHLRIIDADLASLRAQLLTIESAAGSGGESSLQLNVLQEADGVVAAGPDDVALLNQSRKRRGLDALDPDPLEAVSVPGAASNGMGSDVPDDVDNLTTTSGRPAATVPLPAKLTSRQRRALREHAEDLEEAYEEGRLNGEGIAMESIASSSAAAPDPLNTFRGVLSHCMRYSRVRTLARLHYGDGLTGGTNSIVSAIEFDRDDEYFATAGVTKKIKIFEYASVVADYSSLYGGRSETDISTETTKQRRRGGSTLAKRRPGSSVAVVASAVAAAEDSNRRMRKGRGGKRSKRNAVVVERIGEDDDLSDEEEEEEEAGDGVPRYPVREMNGRSKISCVSWNTYIKSHLVSSDYEGVVTLWDAATGQAVSHFDEHEKRAWSVEFSRMDPMMVASGSDDAKAKIWSTNQRHSVCTIEAKANVCSVRFNPEVNYQVAFGSADHFVHYYDIRNPSQPIHSFKGHKKAVSYVKFAGKDDVVTASTDGTLKLWSIPETLRTGTSSITRTFSGHVNEKNFVGLNVNNQGELFACGSESNEVFIYHRALARPLLTHGFGAPLVSTTGEPASESDASQFTEGGGDRVGSV